MTKRFTGLDLDERVRNWLSSQSPSVHFSEDIAEKGIAKNNSYAADFIVFKPFPLAIVTSAPVGHSAHRMLSKRILAQRIALAERFGNAMPVIVVIPNDGDVASVSYADMVLSMEQLPDFNDLLATIKLNQDVQSILKEGEPGEIEFTDLSELKDTWRHTLSLDDLSSDARTFPDDSLAMRLQSALSPLKIEAASNRAQESQPSHRSSGLRPNQQRLQDRPWWYHSRHWSDEFDSVIFQYITEKCGGKIETKRQRNPSQGGIIQRHVWKTDRGMEFVLRRHVVNPSFESHKTNELVAEAWMTRAYITPKVCGQLLLTGHYGQDHMHEGTQPHIKDKDEQPFLPNIHKISALQAAGWHIFPWDFAEQEPKFIKFLKEVAHV
jgi:hypothetical protein